MRTHFHTPTLSGKMNFMAAKIARVINDNKLHNNDQLKHANDKPEAVVNGSLEVLWDI